MNATLQTYSVVLESNLKPSALEYRLRVRYVARVYDNLRGLYRVAVLDENNNKR